MPSTAMQLTNTQTSDRDQPITETQTANNSANVSAVGHSDGDPEKAETKRKYKPGEKWKSQEVHEIPYKYV